MKVKQIHFNGIREANYNPGFGHCMECVHLVTISGVYRCAMRDKISISDTRFPYDNTKCEDFKNGNEKQ